ncbi:MAG: hypothetical protein AAGF67_16920 [Verrucomicrobiota bacterium]
MKKLLWLWIAVFVCGTPAARTHNNYFLPGDAFFSVTLTLEVIREWMGNETSEFDFLYSRYDGDFMACGNIGYSKLQVRGIDENFRTSLTEAYWRYARQELPLYRLESRDPEELSQTNGVVALIYNADFDGPLGLKLNEDWQTEGAGRYGGLFSESEPVVLDWKLGPEFSPLRVDQELGPIAHLEGKSEFHRPSELLLTADAANLKIALVGFTHQERYAVTQTCPNLQQIYDREEGARFIVACADQMEDHSCNKNGSWEEEVIVFPIPKQKSAVPKSELSRLHNVRDNRDSQE